ncbi:MAG: hypothetical protein J1F18_12440, partial [Lachnospiraceae bacterium]|nr:hypothetical protein [Lachnospiraceae bacterium]
MSSNEEYLDNLLKSLTEGNGNSNAETLSSPVQAPADNVQEEAIAAAPSEEVNKAMSMEEIEAMFASMGAVTAEESLTEEPPMEEPLAEESSMEEPPAEEPMQIEDDLLSDMLGMSGESMPGEPISGEELLPDEMVLDEGMMSDELVLDEGTLP